MTCKETPGMSDMLESSWPGALADEAVVLMSPRRSSEDDLDSDEEGFGDELAEGPDDEFDDPEELADEDEDEDEDDEDDDDEDDDEDDDFDDLDEDEDEDLDDDLDDEDSDDEDL
ncbi:hypothetical protein PYV61_10805 [Roseisolibacter sp. H3M3-2]|nr:hypothetical protein [Roseisolibacter sp. H3M3-2]